MLQATHLIGFGAKRAAVSGSYTTTGVSFDGSDVMLRGADFTGSTDSKTLLLSAWVKLNGGDGTRMQLLCGTDEYVSIHRDTANKWYFILYNSNGSTVAATGTSSNTYTSSSGWHHLAIAVDAAASTAQMYINGASDITGASTTNATIDYTRGNYGVGRRVNTGIWYLNADVADLYFAPGQFLDLSNAANLQKFRSSGGAPVDLGSDGSTPTGVQPIAFFKGPATGFNTNLGSGGNMTVTGTLTDASTNPP